MPTRDFLILPAAAAAGDEITVDRAASGFEITCSFCGAVTMRRQRRNEDALVDDTIRTDRFSINLEVTYVTQSAGAMQLRVPLDACEACGTAVLSPFRGEFARYGLSIPEPDLADVDELRAAASGHVMAALVPVAILGADGRDSGHTEWVRVPLGQSIFDVIYGNAAAAADVDEHQDDEPAAAE
jgi:hypothetical protein